ncbi:D-alanyl-D-alanine carboxypeptidase [Guyparkeria hydrothermalis]|uniref:D-alanyl-D-alanine carboxypeptidase family protein n=1 Tax=Guyparkeria hydrothermalis TaxID=923 RepID=UPI00201FBC98|nr:D-alanyl-D-alanine carboxypeptidase family protein [Guyparkeria hydrothermalis]MCL7751924.1 D-alanyl-D-alanine carboxypeptidase [Guyparkeria hydrothermalis]
MIKALSTTWRGGWFAGLLATTLLSLVATSTYAALPTPGAPDLSARSYVLLDYATEQVIVERDADRPVPPASITKLMTAYLAFQAIKSGNIALDDQVTVSEKAWRMGGSRMFIEVGTQVTVEALLQGMIVQSGNDAATALAEYIGGNEDSFVAQMNATAERLGMDETHFENPTGWPAEGHRMSARDIATLLSQLIHEFPDLYKYFRQKSYTYGGIKQYNREKLLFRNEWVDGGKTGHTEAAGYCLATSGARDGMRLIAVVLGTDSDEARNNQAEALLNYGFRHFETVDVRSGGETLASPRVYKGEMDQTPVGLRQDLSVLVPKNQRDDLAISLKLDGELTAPLNQGDAVGSLVVRLGEQAIAERPVVALSDNPEGGLVKQATDSFWLWWDN